MIKSFLVLYLGVALSASAQAQSGPVAPVSDRVSQKLAEIGEFREWYRADRSRHGKTQQLYHLLRDWRKAALKELWEKSGWSWKNLRLRTNSYRVVEGSRGLYGLMVDQSRDDNWFELKFRVDLAIIAIMEIEEQIPARAFEPATVCLETAFRFQRATP